MEWYQKLHSWLRALMYWIKNIHWGTGSQILQGVGTCLAGIGAIIALCQTSTILDKMLNVEKAVTELVTAVDMLNYKVIESYAEKKINSFNVFKQEGVPNIIELETAVKSIPNNETSGSAIFLPLNKRKEVIEQLKNTTKSEERVLIFQKFLEYKPHAP